MNHGNKLLERFRRLFKPRFAVLYPAAAWALWTLRASGVSFRYGVTLIVAGLLLRSWANCYAIKMDKLTTSGPYAYLRHPLYAGTLLMLIGFAVLLNAQWWGVIFTLVFLAVYVKTMRAEELMLLQKFGDAYRVYRAKVPPLWPCLRPFTDGEKWPVSAERYWRSQEYKLILWTFVLILIIYLLAARDENFGGWSDPMRAAAGAIVVLALADAAITAALKSRSRSSHV